MKKFVTIFGVVLAALALAGVAWAATAQGKLTGELKWNTPGQAVRRPGTNGIHAISTTATAGWDSGTARPTRSTSTRTTTASGNCTGDSGTVVVQYNRRVGERSRPTPSICAHYSNTITM